MGKMNDHTILNFFSEMNRVIEENVLHCPTCQFSNLTEVTRTALDEVKSMKNKRKFKKLRKSKVIKHIRKIEAEFLDLPSNIVSYVKAGMFTSKSNSTCHK